MTIRTPDLAAFGKLPKWAQSYIHDLEMSVSAGEQALKEYVDTQTPSPFSTLDMVCMTENKLIPRYIQANTVTCESAGVKVTMSPKDDGVDVSFEAATRAAGDVALEPQASNLLRIRKVKYEYPKR
jgi:hypothetical protein